MKVKVNKKKVGIIVFLIVVIFICGNAFAALVGAPNIFFAIKDLVNEQSLEGEENLLSDREIVISYTSLEIADGLKIQVNKMVIEETKSTLYLSVQDEKDRELTYKWYDKTEEKMSKMLEPKIADLPSVHMINFDYKVGEKSVIELGIYENEKILKTLEIDLGNKVITVDGEEEVEKLSEVELKKYLGCFSILNYDDLKINDRLIYIAEQLNSEIFNDQMKTKSKRELIMAIVDSFYSEEYTTEKVNGVEILKADEQQYDYDEELDSYMSLTEGSELPIGLCLEIENISYKSGVYTVEFTYVYPTYMDYDENKIEELEQYKTTIKLELDKDAEYSKYKVIDLEKGTLIEKAEANDSEGTITNEADCEKLVNSYLKIYFNVQQDSLNLPIDLGLADKYDIRLYDLVDLKDKPGSFYNTNIEYSKYKNKMLKYMTEGCMNLVFSEYTNNVNDILYILSTGGSEIYYKITEFKLDSKSENTYNYKAKIVTYAQDHADLTEYEKTPKNMDVTIEKQGEKFVIDSINIDYTDYTLTEKNDNNEVNTNVTDNNENNTNTSDTNANDKIDINVTDTEIKFEETPASEVTEKESPLKTDKFISSLNWTYFGCAADTNRGTIIPMLEGWEYEQFEEIEDSTKIRAYISGYVENNMKLSVFMHDPIKIDKNTTEEQIINKLMYEGGIGNNDTEVQEDYVDTHGRKYIVLTHDWIFNDGNSTRNIYYCRTVEMPNGDTNVYYVRFTYSYDYLENENMDKVIKYMLDEISFV